MSNLAIRETTRYRAGWAYLDTWQSIGRFTVEDKTEPDYGPDDYNIEEYHQRYMFIRVELDQPEPFERIRNAIRDEFSGSSCQHEYDCCGCWHRSCYDVWHLEENLWLARVGAGRNY